MTDILSKQIRRKVTGSIKIIVFRNTTFYTNPILFFNLPYTTKVTPQAFSKESIHANAVIHPP